MDAYRLGRSLKDLVELLTQFREKNIGFKCLNRIIDTTTSEGKLTFNVCASLAEFNRERTVENTRAGLAAARARGRLVGRRARLSPRQQGLAVKLYRERKPPKEICELMGISKPTLYNYLKKAASQ